MNKNCKAESAEWTSAELRPVRAVRLHVSLPRFSASEISFCQVHGDELAVHLDMTNLHLLLGNSMRGLYELLAVATMTNVEDRGKPE